MFDINSGKELYKLSKFKVEEDMTALATKGRHIATTIASGQVLINLIWGDELLRK